MIYPPLVILLCLLSNLADSARFEIGEGDSILYRGKGEDCGPWLVLLKPNWTWEA